MFLSINRLRDKTLVPTTILQFIILILIILIILIIVTIIGTGCKPAMETPPSAVNGFLDLSQWDFEIDGNVRLNGEWEFYWQELYGAKDFVSGKAKTPDLMVIVPSVWNNLEISPSKLKGDGFATYRLRLKVSEEAINKIMSVFSQDQATSYLVLINDQEVAGYGTVGNNADNATPNMLSSSGSFNIPGQEFDIIVQVSNFSDCNGGFWRSVYLGNDTGIKNFEFQRKKRDTLLMGIIFIIFMYHIMIYFFRKNDKTSLYFALVCLIFFLRSGVTNEKLLQQELEALPFLFFLTIEYITLFLTVPVIIHFLYYLFPGNIKHKIMLIAYYISIPFIIITLFTPQRIFSHTIPFFLVILSVSIIYILSLLIYLYIKKEKYVALILIGVSVMVITAINDILHTLMIISTGYLVAYGLIFLIFSQSAVLAMKHSQTYKSLEISEKEIEKAYHNIEELNKSLERKVSKRTIELTESNQKLTDANQKLQELDKHKTETLNMVTHDLRTPLTSIVGFSKLTNTKYQSIVLPVMQNMDDKKVKSNANQILENLKIIEEEGHRLTNLINNFLDLAKLEEGKVTLNTEQLDIREFMGTSLKSVQFLAKQKKLELIIDLEPDLPKVTGDREKLIQVMINLLSNAIKFTSVGSISCKAVKDNNKIIISVTDTGSGIPKEEQDIIFEKFKQVGKQDGLKLKGTGLGLTICKQIIELHGGHIWVESEPDEGSSFCFSLQVNRGDGSRGF